jgi:flagellar basal-body rod protein FlgG
MQRTNLDPANMTGRPVNLQVGLGVRAVATSRDFNNGNLNITGQPLDIALIGEGFFVIQRPDGEITFTRAGAFKVSLLDDGSMLTTAEGYPILSTEGEPIIIPLEVQISQIVINQEGQLTYQDVEFGTVDLGYQIAVVQFGNPQGLEAIGETLFRQTTASGAPLYEAYGETNTLTQVLQGAIEMSNVQVATEMVNLIVAQRAYELNARVITTSDEMLQQAANLKR